MDFKDIKLGERYWCVFKASVVDPKVPRIPDFVLHLGVGIAQSKGMQLDEAHDKLLFVEIAGQRIKASHVFESPEGAVDALEAMMDKMTRGLATASEPEKTVPPHS